MKIQFRKLNYLLVSSFLLLLFFWLLFYFHILNRKTVSNITVLISEKFKTDQSIIIAGDSRVEGILFPDQINGLRIINLGVSGSNTQYWIDFFKIPTLFSKDQKIVIWIGINDFLWGRDAIFVFNQIGKLKTIMNGNQILIMNQIQIDGDKKNEVNREILKFNELLKNSNYEIIDVENTFRNFSGEYLKRDGIHLTETGNNFIVQLIKTEVGNRWK